MNIFKKIKNTKNWFLYVRGINKIFKEHKELCHHLNLSKNWSGRIGTILKVENPNFTGDYSIDFLKNNDEIDYIRYIMDNLRDFLEILENTGLSNFSSFDYTEFQNEETRLYPEYKFFVVLIKFLWE